MATSSWFELFSYSKLYNLEGSPSDHSAIFLEPICTNTSLRKKRFRFKNAWLTEPLCSVIFLENWESTEVSNVQQKIQLCVDNLSVWGKEVRSCFNKRIKECHQKLKLLRRKQDDQSIREYKDTKHRLFLILNQKETF